MLFNSVEFAVFFIIVYSLYLVLPHRWQNLVLLAASYIFYGAWDWRFLSLIVLSTILDYYCGLKIEASVSRRRKFFLYCSMTGNLSLLGFFKYYDFFAENLQAGLAHFGFAVDPHFLHIILPVGISFYTFQTMSYTIDIYRGELKPTRRFLDFALFVSFFPQLVAGPIERAKRLLPQILRPRTLALDEFYRGCYLILWGLFLKVFIADNLSAIVDPVFSSPGPYDGISVILALYSFAFQIFCDFASYSHIARGLAKCMGFDLMVNFNLPYFAVNPRDFWRRWHISLSTWLRDYLYISLGGNKKGTIIMYRNLAFTMLLGGLWHGAAWTFIIWGAYQGLLLIGHRVLEPYLKKGQPAQGSFADHIWFLLKIIFFFQLTCIGWLIFRAQSVSQIGSMLKSLAEIKISHGHYYSATLGKMGFYLGVLVCIQIIQFRKNDLLAVLRMPAAVRTAVYYIVIILLVFFGVTGAKEFIYFQF